MSANEERKDGWYWVRLRGHASWMAVSWDAADHYFRFGGGKLVLGDRDEIGSRIPFPDEPAPVPSEPDDSLTGTADDQLWSRAEVAAMPAVLKKMPAPIERPEELKDAEGLLELCDQATEGPWEATLCGEAGVYVGLTVKSPGHIKYKARVLAPGADESDLDDLRDEIDDGETDPANLNAGERALLQLEDNLKFAAAARTALPAAIKYALALESELARLRADKERQLEILRKALADEPWVDAAKELLYPAARKEPGK